MVDFKNEFSWSFSRYNTFKECRRKYYYQYYGYWGGWSKNADETARKLYVLKHLQNRWMWKGASVHHEIERILKELAATKRLYPLEKSLTRITEMRREEFRSSRDRRYWDKDGSLKRETALFEHEYGVDVEDKAWVETNEEVKNCIVNFYNSDTLAALTQLNKEDFLYVEDLIEFKLQGEKIFVKLDLAYREDDKIKIVDWKTGESDSDELQLAVYVIYILESEKAPPENLYATEYNLRANKKRTHQFSTQDIIEAKKLISNGIEEMKRLLRDPVENTADMADFQRTEDSWKCEGCNFKGICFDLD